MLVRLAEFVTSYAPHDRPALIAHASPENRALEVDLADDVPQTTLRQGSGGSIAWWEGFDAPGGLRPAFRGLACRNSRDDPRC